MAITVRKGRGLIILKEGEDPEGRFLWLKILKEG